MVDLPERRFCVAKAYRLLHAIFETAVDDQMVRRNRCRIEGAGKEESPEREIVSPPVVFAIADALPVRYRAMALPATFASMRWGELVGLRRENIDLDACEVPADCPEEARGDSWFRFCRPHLARPWPSEP